MNMFRYDWIIKTQEEIHYTMKKEVDNNLAFQDLVITIT